MNIGSINQKNTIFHVNGINRRFALSSFGQVKGNNQNERRDTLMLSPQGKQQSVLAGLMKQRQDILDRRSELVVANAEKGGQMSDIKSQLDLYEEQLKNLDEQIKQASMEELNPKEKERGNQNRDRFLTEEESNQKKMSSLTALVTNLDHVDVVNSVKGKVDGEIRVLKAQVKVDLGDVTPKLEQIARLESESNELFSQVGEMTGEINQNAEDLNANQELKENPKEIQEEDPTLLEALQGKDELN